MIITSVTYVSKKITIWHYGKHNNYLPCKIQPYMHGLPTDLCFYPSNLLVYSPLIHFKCKCGINFIDSCINIHTCIIMSLITQTFLPGQNSMSYLGFFNLCPRTHVCFVSPYICALYNNCYKGFVPPNIVRNHGRPYNSRIDDTEHVN